MKNCCHNSENCILRERERDIIPGFTEFIRLTYADKKWLDPQQKHYLLFLTYSNNIHGSLSGEIIMSITYTNQFIAIWLIKIVKWFRVSQLVSLFLLVRIRIYYLKWFNFYEILIKGALAEKMTKAEYNFGP